MTVIKSMENCEEVQTSHNGHLHKIQFKLALYMNTTHTLLYMINIFGYRLTNRCKCYKLADSPYK